MSLGKRVRIIGRESLYNGLVSTESVRGEKKRKTNFPALLRLAAETVSLSRSPSRGPLLQSSLTHSGRKKEDRKEKRSRCVPVSACTVLCVVCATVTVPPPPPSVQSSTANQTEKITDVKLFPLLLRPPIPLCVKTKNCTSKNRRRIF